MTSTTVKEYKGYTITIDEAGVFYAQDKEKNTMAKSENLKVLQRQIDDFSKGKFGQTVYINIYEHYYDASKLGYYKKAKLTSIKAKKRYGSYQMFRVSIEGSWREVQANEIIKDIEENRKILSELEALQAEVESIKGKIKEKVNKLQTYTVKELTGEEP
jgi:hypothetical protein